MDIGEWLKTFVIDTWYKAILFAGAGLFILSLCVEVKGISNGQLQLLSSGLFLLGLGVWKNDKVANWIKPPNVYTGPAAFISAKVRSPDSVGLFFELSGALLIFLFFISIIIWGVPMTESPKVPPNLLR